MSESVSINVTGMKCGGCENSLSTKLSALKGVLAVKASHIDKRVEVEFDNTQLDIDDIEDAIIEAGFKVE